MYMCMSKARGAAAALELSEVRAAVKVLQAKLEACEGTLDDPNP